MVNPKISVLMAVYNGEDSIRTSIESILSQTYKDFEFIIVNDCSTDGTLDIVKSYNDRRIVIINNERNLSQVKSLNIGIKQAKGEYIATIDADDFAYPSRLEEQLTYFKNYPEYAAIGTSALRVYPKSGKKILYRGATTPSEVMVRLFYTTPLLHVSVMMRRDAVLRIGGYDERFLICADHALWSCFIRNRYKIISLPDILVKKNMSAESYSMRNQERFVSEYSQLLMENINSLTDLRVSYDDVEKLSHMFKSRSNNLTNEEYEKAQLLFKDIFSHLKDPWKRSNISMEEIIRPLVMVYRHKATYYLKNFQIIEARKTVYEATKKHGFRMYFFLIFIASFLGKFILGKLVRLRDARYNVWIK